MEEKTCPCLSLYASWLDSLEHISPLESENEHVYQLCIMPYFAGPRDGQWGCHEMLICEESIHCGCIPVILSDEYEVAFQHVIAAWHVFVTSWGRAMLASCMFLLSCSFYRRCYCC